METRSYKDALESGSISDSKSQKDLRISTSELEIEEAKKAIGGESKGRGEMSPIISTST
jgi:hypothetical protein